VVCDGSTDTRTRAGYATQGDTATEERGIPDRREWDTQVRDRLLIAWFHKSFDKKRGLKGNQLCQLRTVPPLLTEAEA